MAAGEIERVVVDCLRAVLRDHEVAVRIGRVTTAEPPLKPEEIRDALQNVDALWNELFPAGQARIVELLVEEVAVQEQGIVLKLRQNGLHSLALESQGAEQAAGLPKDAGDPVTVRIPMEFKRRRGRKEIIVPADGALAVEPAAPPQEPLVLALAQARQWQDMLDAGKVKTASELAKRLHLSREYVTRTLSLNYLAPDIVQAILDGRDPSGLSLAKLTEPLPSSWAEQPARLGFASVVRYTGGL